MQDRDVLGSKLKLANLILKKVIKIVATRIYVKAKMHKIRFRLGPAPDPAGGAYSAAETP